MIKRMKVLELVMDWQLWPRYEANDLDATNINSLKEAMQAGVVLPPIVADESSLRIIDGFHRVSAYLSLYGDSVETDVDLRKYENETEMFIEAARSNNTQGLKLSQKDKVHVMLTLRRKKVPMPRVAEILSIPLEKAKAFLDARTATTEKGKKIPLSYGASNLAGKRLNSKQEKYARTANGMLPIVNARLLMNALKANSFPLTEKEIEVLVQLREIIDAVLNGEEVKKA